MIVVVLGMHRSGTSLVSGVLSKMGVNMGKRLLKPSVENPKGYFEDLEFFNLNATILHEAGGDWKAPPNKETLLKVMKKNREKFRDIINRKNKNSKLWGWKDPRTVLTIDGYMNFLSPKKTKFIIVFRNSLTIAHSLNKKKKEKFRVKVIDGLELSSIYNCELARFIKKYPRYSKLFLAYESILQNKEENIKKISEFIGIKANDNIYSFIDNKLDRSSKII